MRSLLQVIATTALALAILWFAVIVQGDTTIAVPPPASVAEQFSRLVAAGRYDRTLGHVDEASGITLITVRLGGEALHRRARGIDDVAGEPGGIAGDQATATAVLSTRAAGRIRYAFTFVRRKGEWKVVDWQERR